MNKKFFVMSLILLGGVFGLFANVTHAAEKFTQDDLNSVDVRFCDKVGDLEYRKIIYAEDVGKEYKVNFCVYNKSTKRIPITYGFTTATHNSVGNRVCNAVTDVTDNNFPLIPVTKNRTIYVEPLESKMIEEKIIIPPGMTGLQMGCLTAELGVDTSVSIGSVFVLKIRKAFDLDVVIGKPVEVKNSIKMLNTTGGIYSTNKKVKAVVDKDNNLSIGFLVENDGNVAQNITITGKVYNALGFEKEFVLANKVIAPQATSELMVNVGLLPVYKGLFSVKFALQNEPQSTMGVKQGEELSKIGYIVGQAQIFVFARRVIVAAILLLFILYRAFFVRKIVKA